ncbi:MAG: class II fumarate hydratase [Myxococcota bacterium]
MPFRIEKDALGEVRVPADAVWGAQTQRAVENFPISGRRVPRRLVHALGVVKRACAETNGELGLLPGEIAGAIAAVAQEVAGGKWDDAFPVDVFQTGSGTSTNMNANEVIANVAITRLGGAMGTKSPVHPNDHVNLCQSSNDVIPTAIHVAGAVAIAEDLVPALRALHAALADKARAFDDVLKSGRTHLMDATPVRLGQEVGGWARQVELGIGRVERARDALLELALGGTATGTGINRPPEFPAKAIARIAAATGLPFREAADHFEAQGAADAIVEASALVRTVAVSLHKIANDVRLLASGPRAGLAELRLPETQPGSSIMPGKVNPVMCEMLAMVACEVVGNDAAVTLAGQGGYLELNVYLPLLGEKLVGSVEVLARAVRVFTERCVVGMEADREACARGLERNLALSTALAPVIGYDRAATLSREALASGRTVREVAAEWGVGDLDRLLDARAMTEPGEPGSGG